MLKQDSLDWTVSKREIFVPGVDGENSFRAIVRDDTNAILAVRTDAYEPLQNATLKELAGMVQAESGASLHGSWALRGGKLVGIQLEDGEFSVPGDPSKFRDRFGFFNSHDGSTPVIGGINQTRIVCQNTFLAAMGESNKNAQKGYGWRYHHTSSLTDRIEQVRDFLSAALQERNRFIEWAEARHAQDVDFDAFVRYLVPDSDSTLDSVQEEIESTRSLLASIRERSTNAGLRKDSVYAALNVGIEWMDHDMEPKRRTKNAESNKLLRTIGLAPGKDRIYAAARKAIR